MGHAGHVERHSAQEAVSTRVVLPLAVIATNNVSRMVELWSQFRCVAKPWSFLYFELCHLIVYISKTNQLFSPTLNYLSH